MSSGNPENLKDLLGNNPEGLFRFGGASLPHNHDGTETSCIARRLVRNLQGKARKKRMGNKLVFVSGAPFWFTPEGRFEAAEQSNGLFVERVMLRTERGLREIVNGKVVR